MTNTRILFVLILFLAIVFRFWHMTTIPPGLYPDEAMNGTNALQALENRDFQPYYTDNNGREGLFINIIAFFILLFGNEPWVLRVVSALFGLLAVIGIYFLGKELFYEKNSQFSILNSQFWKLKHWKLNSRGEIIALLSSFFLATSYWHITLSRIGFRAITAPTFSIFAFFFFFRGMRRGSLWDFALSGIMLGLGLNGYIAFRFIPFVFMAPILIGLWRWWDKRQMQETNVSSAACFPCNIVLMGIFALAISTPLITYFAAHPEDFATRTGQVSVFADEYPLRAFAISNIKTISMLFVFGDCNPRHNFPCLPALHPVAAIAFLYGLYTLYKRARASLFLHKPLPLADVTLAAWLFFMALPATLTREGMPHALRSIGMIPPVMIIAGLGAYMLWEKLAIIWKRTTASCIALTLLAVIPLTTGYLYFGIWAQAPATASAFSQDITELAQYVRTLPPYILKYLIVDLDHDGLPVSAQSVVYLTNTATLKTQQEWRVSYIPRTRTLNYITLGNSPAIIAFVAFRDTALEQEIEQMFPTLVKEQRGGFTVYTYQP